MDSLTQAVLGAGVTAAVLGPRIGPRKAAALGAVLGSLPDLDVFWPFDDPVEAFVLHRSASHSLLMHAVVTPVLAEAVMRMFRDLRRERGRSWLAVYLALSTHALLDALTIYGTQLFWPLSARPFGTGSVFIIDPLYTIPLLVVTVWALCIRAWTGGFERGLTAALLVSTGYLGWGLVGQQIATQRAEAVMAARGIEPSHVIATAAPFNTLFWRVIAVDDDRYLNVYVPILGGAADVTVYEHPRLPNGDVEMLKILSGIKAAGTLMAFSKGFWRAERDGVAVVVADLRMGLTPAYVFRFAVAEALAVGMVSVAPRRVPLERTAEGDIDWLLAGIAGTRAVRPAEATRLID
ncbi:MAG: metal-dependent hydrolase [Alphaproteobacteria bacterium]|nr:metal-dependent hydrolase [Alphaproteobacteria bacterium]